MRLFVFAAILEKRYKTGFEFLCTVGIVSCLSCRHRK